MTFTCNPPDTGHNIPHGYCRQSPINGVSMIFNTRFFDLQNVSGQDKLVVVKRTLQTGLQEDFPFRINSAHGWAPHVLAFAGTDTGRIEVVKVVPSPFDGSLDDIDQIQEIRYRGEVPGLHNRSPRPLFVSALIYEEGERFPRLLQFTFAPFQDIPTAGDDVPVRYEFHAAELQKASLYPPYF